MAATASPGPHQKGGDGSLASSHLPSRLVQQGVEGGGLRGGGELELFQLGLAQSQFHNPMLLSLLFSPMKATYL